MKVDLIVLFIVLNVLNVIIQTVKSIVTVKGGKVVAAIVNAIAYGLYTVVIVYMVCDLNLWFKVAIVAGTNLIGVFLVKLLEEKKRKDKLWKIEITLPKLVNYAAILRQLNGIPHNYIDIDKYIIINCYCATQKQTARVIEVAKNVNAKYFVTESKL